MTDPVTEYHKKHEERKKMPLQEDDFRELFQILDRYTRNTGSWGSDDEIIERCRQFLIGLRINKIKCPRCNHINLINPNMVHGEEGDPFQLHCTYCTKELN